MRELDEVDDPEPGSACPAKVFETQEGSSSRREERSSSMGLTFASLSCEDASALSFFYSRRMLRITCWIDGPSMSSIA